MRKSILATAAMAAAMTAAPVAMRTAEAGAIVEPPPVTTTTTTTTPTSKSSTKAFVGLNWTFGAKSGPELVLGVASAKAKPSGRVTGARASVHVGLGEGVKFNGAKLTGFSGNRTAQAEIGFGIGGAGGMSPFAIAGFMGRNVNAGIDVYFDQRVAPYIGVHTLGKFKPGSVTTTTTTTTTLPFCDDDDSSECVLKPT